MLSAPVIVRNPWTTAAEHSPHQGLVVVWLQHQLFPKQLVAPVILALGLVQLALVLVWPLQATPGQLALWRCQWMAARERFESVYTCCRCSAALLLNDT
jgi:endonuclease/exonuclease/phosphatase (EEP) superfamily protein YafD